MKRTRNDISGVPKNKLPPVPPLDLIFYHWSPTTNRASINKKGLTPGRLTLQGLWRPPYVAFADDPKLGWFLSGRMYPEIPSWDLWMCYEDNQTSFDGYEIITDTYPDSGRHFRKEYRVYTRVFKRDLYYLATRTQ